MTAASTGQKTVLVIEDDPWTRTITTALLAGEGFAVVEANENGQLADLIAMRTGLLAHHRLCKTNGRPVVPAEVAELSEKILANKAQPRELMTLGS